MSDHIQITFQNISAEQSAIMIAQFSEMGFTGFEETENGLLAFIPADEFEESMVKDVTTAPFTKTIVRETNWNEVWESNFEPVIVDDFVTVRAEFHQSAKGVEHEIIITPKMSFGTGHHATTYMMIQQMRQINFEGRTVLDFGTGTGVLAILAEKLGAKQVVAIDNDDWSIANAAENIDRNDCRSIRLEKAESVAAVVENSFDIILANINKNVILQDFSVLAKKMATDGILLLSGLLPEDENDIFRKKNEYSLQIIQTGTKANWLCIKLSR